MKAKSKKKTIGVIGIVLVLLLGILLVLILPARAQSGESLFGTRVVRAEPLYIILIFLLLLPLVLLFLLISLLVEKYTKPDKTVLHASRVLANGKTAQCEVRGEPSTAPVPAGSESAADGEGAPEEQPAGGRFCKLTILDETRNRYLRSDYDDTVTLRHLCDNFRNYAASRLKLYYDIADIRRFIAGLAVSRLLILQGMSGTGKTSLAHAFGDFMDNVSTVIPVQPMWKERTDLIGYYNEFTKRFNETTLLEKMYEANYSKDLYITVLDEMNIARVEYYFAEFLSLLELPNEEERLLTVVSDVWADDPAQLQGGAIKLPPNMWFIGTANNDDSTFAISDKVYDRAMILNLDIKCEPFEAPLVGKMRFSAAQFERLARQAMREYEITARNLGRLLELDKYLIEHFHITFGNRIMKQIREYIPVYVACGGEELEALDDILSKKVLRKLEMQNPIYLRNAAGGLCAYLDELFGEGRMPLCHAFMERLQRTV